jgi:hypothetical protein
MVVWWSMGDVGVDEDGACVWLTTGGRGGCGRGAGSMVT